jgi:hypothetical protein
MVEGADPPLFGRGALVTGTGRGIGRVIAQRLTVLGATVPQDSKSPIETGASGSKSRFGKS